MKDILLSEGSHIATDASEKELQGKADLAPLQVPDVVILYSCERKIFTRRFGSFPRLRESRL